MRLSVRRTSWTRPRRRSKPRNGGDVMPHFAYEARTEDGNLVSGVIAAADLEEAGRKLCASMQEGRPLSDAMENFPRSFPSIVTATIRASEASGTLSTVLSRTGQYMVKDEQNARRLRGSLMYPLFMFFMCVAVTLFLVIVI